MSLSKKICMACVEKFSPPGSSWHGGYPKLKDWTFERVWVESKEAPCPIEARSHLRVVWFPYISGEPPPWCPFALEHILEEEHVG